MADDPPANEGHASDAPHDGVPPGWDYNPATWGQRMPIVILALIGGAVALYITLYQWGVFKTVWEPFFGGGPDHPNGSAKIFNSPTSRPLPFIPWLTDGFLGFLGYVGDAVTGVIGGTKRWRTMPWVVIVFGILVGPLGAVSIGLVMAQPLVYGTFSTTALFTACVSVLMIGPAMDEMLASLQYMKRAREHGRPFWRTFFGLGDQDPLPERTADLAATRSGGLVPPGVHWVVALIGVYLMASSDLWGYDRPAGVVERVVGPLVIAAAVISAWEATRNVRRVNLLLGATLLVVPAVVGASTPAIINDALCGVAILALTLLPYRPTQTFGGGWPRLWHDRSV